MNVEFYRALGTYAPEELLIIDVIEPGEYDAEEYAGESWPSTLLYSLPEGVEEHSAPDYEGTTEGSRRGIAVLLPAAYLNDWCEAATEIGATVEISSVAVGPGHYGDGSWPGVELVELEDGRLTWYER